MDCGLTSGVGDVLRLGIGVSTLIYRASVEGEACKSLNTTVMNSIGASRQDSAHHEMAGSPHLGESCGR